MEVLGEGWWCAVRPEGSLEEAGDLTGTGGARGVRLDLGVGRGGQPSGCVLCVGNEGPSLALHVDFGAGSVVAVVVEAVVAAAATAAAGAAAVWPA